MWLVWSEAKKHQGFREVWVGYILGLLYLLICFYTEGSSFVVTGKAFAWQQNWYFIQQNIYSYGAALTAFLLVIGLPRLVCYEKEQKTDSIIGTSGMGRFLTWRSKVIYAVVYCAAVVWIIGTASLLVFCGAFHFEGAFDLVESCVYFMDETLPPMSNIAYCILQYVFLFLGALYFAGFILLVAAMTRRTALTVCLCGAAYIVCMVYEYVGSIFSSYARQILGFFFRFGFGGYLLQDSYSWSWAGRWGNWADLWKPVLLAIVMIILEFAGLWLLWRRRAIK